MRRKTSVILFLAGVLGVLASRRALLRLGALVFARA
jgi:hypothetical protein